MVFPLFIHSGITAFCIHLFILLASLLWMEGYYYYHLHWSFSHHRQLMDFPWSLNDSKSSQVSRTLLSILAVLNNVVIWMVSTRPPTSKSSSRFSNPLVTLPKAPITIGIIVTFMFNSFFSNSLARSRFLSFFHILSVLFCGQADQQNR